MAAEALSLGRSRGAALLGRPLEVSILAALDPQEATPEANCFSPEVFYGDTRIGAQNVSVTPVRTSPTELSLQVRSTTPIDEPFVTVYVRSACGTNVSRRYVLLSDSPSEPAPSQGNNTVAPLAVVPPVARVPGASPASVGAPVARALPAIIDPETAAKLADRAAKRAALRLEQRQAAKAAAIPAKNDPNAKESEASTSPLSPRAEAQRLAKLRTAMSPALGASAKASSGRLKIDLLDTSSGRDPSLRASAELLSQPTTDMQARAQAAALWRAINLSPEDLLRDTQRLKALESEVRSMSELTKQQTKELGTLKSDLVQAERSKYANPLVYALAALALAALGFAAWLWQRSRSLSAPWWGSAPSQKDSSLGGDRKKPAAGRFSSQASSAAEEADRERELGFVAASKLIAPVSAHAPLAAGPASPPTFISRNGAAAQSLPVQTRLTGMQPASALGSKAVPNEPREKSPDFEPSASAGLRPVNAEELFDIQQQADFFMSLGQHSQAIDILQNHIGENVETSALAYLDLFDIYHKVGMRNEFDALREEFNRVFNAQVPEYDQYGLTSRGLEQYATAMDRIIVLWPNVKVLEVIEESIFRKPDRDNKPFDLLAYRELMLLYAIAKDVCENEEAAGGLAVDFDMSRQPDIALPSAGADLTATVAMSPAPQVKFSVTEIQPLSTTTAVPSLGLHSALRNEPLDNWEQALNNLPLVSKHVGVDIELDGMFDAPPVPNLVVPAPVGPITAAPKAKDNGIDFDATAPFVAKPIKKS